MPSRILSKSRYLNGLQCTRLLWIACNQPSRLPAPDAVTQFVFDQGHEIGELAHRLYPDGISLSTEGFADNLRATQTAMRLRKSLFEAGICSGQLYCRVDILVPAGRQQWDIVEVKSSTEVKEEHLQDVAFQRHVCLLAGLSVRRCHVAHVNKDYIKRGEINPGQLLACEDITADLDPFSGGLQERVEEMLECMRSPGCPESIIGRRCEDPYPCASRKSAGPFFRNSTS